MGNGLKGVIDVSISRETYRSTSAVFGIIAIIGKYDFTNDRYVNVSDASDMLEYGFTVDSEEYKKAKVLLAQDDTIPYVVVGRVNTGNNTKHVLTFGTTPSTGTITFTVGGLTSSAVAAGSDMSADIKAALESIIADSTVSVTAESSTKYTIEYTTLPASYNKFIDVFTTTSTLKDSVNADVEVSASVSVYGNVAETLSEGYAALDDAVSFFYILTTTDFTLDEKKALAVVVEDDIKTMCIALTDTSVLAAAYDAEDTEPDLPTYLKQLGITKTFVVIDTAGNYVDAGIVGVQSTKTPGSSIYMYRTITGVTPLNLSYTQKTNAISKCVNWYDTLGFFRDGYTPSGEWIDIITGSMYITSKVMEDLLTALLSVEKIDGSDAGILAVKNIVLASLTTNGVNTNFIEGEDLTIVVPKQADRSIADKAARRLSSVSFTATLTGALQTFSIKGYLTI